MELLNLIDKYLGEGTKFKKGQGVYIKSLNTISTIIDVFGNEYKTDEGMRDESELEKLQSKHLKMKGVSLPPSVKKKLKL